MIRHYMRRISAGVLLASVLSIGAVALSACSTSYYEEIADMSASVDDLAQEVSDKSMSGDLTQEVADKSGKCVQFANDATLLAVSETQPDDGVVDVDAIDALLSEAEGYTANARSILDGNKDLECVPGD